MAMEEASKNHADILLLPECFITGYDLPMSYEKSISDDDIRIAKICKYAKKYKIGVVLTSFTKGNNMDNGYVEVWFTDGNMLRIKCEEVEAALRTTEQSLAKLHKLLDNKPIEYVVMALSGKMQAYCDIEDDMVKVMFGTIVQGYNRATAEMMAREFFRYES